MSELLLWEGNINVGLGVNWDPLGFSIKPSFSTLQVDESMKIGVGIPIYIKDGVVTGGGFSFFISARGGAGLGVLNGIAKSFAK